MSSVICLVTMQPDDFPWRAQVVILFVSSTGWTVFPAAVHAASFVWISRVSVQLVATGDAMAACS